MQQFAFVLDAMSEPVIFWVDGKVQSCNRAANVLGLQQGDALSVPAEALPVAGQAIETTLTVCGEAFAVSIRPAEDAYLLVLHRETGEHPTDLLAAAARSLQDPLTSMLTAGADLFPLLEELENEEIQAKTATITKGFFRLLRTKTALQEACRLWQEDPHLLYEKTHMKEFFDDLASRWQGMLQDSDITLQYHGPKKAFNGNVDRQVLQQAVLQLLSNAALYHTKGTPIVLTVSYMGDRAKIQVDNCGPAMPPEVLSSVFSRYDAAAPLPDARWGLGLGLSLARQAAKHHDGTILLQSGETGTSVIMTIGLLRPETGLDTPRIDYSGRYDPALVALSDILPADTYDSRNLDL